MRAEYLLFNLVIAGSIALSRAIVPYPAAIWRTHAWLASVVVALPFLVWDAAVTGRHWWFNPNYILGLTVGGLPFEEILFFLTVPLACLFTWEVACSNLGAARPPPPPQGRTAHRRWIVIVTLAFAALLALLAGKEYTAAALVAWASSIVADAFTRARIWGQPRFVGFLLVVCGLTGIFNGYLTARPVVLYDPRYQLDFRIGTIPGEDFIYGTALVAWVVVIYEHCKLAWPAQPKPEAVTGLRTLRRKLWQRFSLAQAIERRFGGYRVHAVVADSQAPRHLRSTLGKDDSPPRLAIIGSGLAGLRAATILQSRGFAVEIFERNAYLGGKIGGWPLQLKSGETVQIEHGFHAFFRHYYNTDRFFEEIGVRSKFCPVDDYLIVDRQGHHLRYGAIAKPPGLNLLSLLWHGHYRFRDVLLNPRLIGLTDLLRYDPQTTFARYDNLSYADFSQKLRLPPSLRLAFNTFARAFFAPPQRMSMAELIKSFHFFFLGQDSGLLYDYPRENYSDAILKPIAKILDQGGTQVHLESAISSIARNDDGSFAIAGRRFAELVVATDLAATKRLLGPGCAMANELPVLTKQLDQLELSSRYAVLRLWIGKPLAAAPSPVFWITDRFRCLDAIAFYSAFEAMSQAWAHEHRGCVLELHSYCVPDELLGDDDVIAAMTADLYDYLPELVGGDIVDRHLYMRRDFPAFSIGQHAHRPGTQCEVPNLVLAGDWLALPWPVMLMEAAVTSGVAAANGILQRYGLALEPIDTVPARGLLVGR